MHFANIPTQKIAVEIKLFPVKQKGGFSVTRWSLQVGLSSLKIFMDRNEPFKRDYLSITNKELNENVR